MPPSEATCQYPAAGLGTTGQVGLAAGPAAGLAGASAGMAGPPPLAWKLRSARYMGRIPAGEIADGGALPGREGHDELGRATRPGDGVDVGATGPRHARGAGEQGLRGRLVRAGSGGARAGGPADGVRRRALVAARIEERVGVRRRGVAAARRRGGHDHVRAFDDAALPRLVVLHELSRRGAGRQVVRPERHRPQDGAHRRIEMIAVALPDQPGVTGRRVREDVRVDAAAEAAVDGRVAVADAVLADHRLGLVVGVGARRGGSRWPCRCTGRPWRTPSRCST